MNRKLHNATRVHNPHRKHLTRPQSRAGIALKAGAFLLALATSPQLLHAATTVSGSVSGTWTQTGSPYLVAGDVLVAPGKSLIIQSNVQVNFLGPYVFEVDGLLQATGTSDYPIIFARAYANVGWEGIFFNEGSSSSSLRFCQVFGSVNSGIRIKNTTPSIKNCVIANNSAPAYGGGINAVVSTGRVVFDNCWITNNTAATSGAAAEGGGVFLDGSANFVRCTISSNSCLNATRTFAGGLFLTGGEANLWNCTIRGNACSSPSMSHASALWVDNGNLTLKNCIVSANTAGNAIDSRFRAAAVVYSGGALTVVNSTLAWNNRQATWGGQITNCIIYYNNASGAQFVGGQNVSFSDVEGGIQPGSGNISLNPSLDPSTLELQPGSVCIDSGHPSFVFDETCFPPSLGEARNDMGAFGGPGACGWLEAPEIIAQPADQTVPAGSNVTFSVVATGTPPLLYQWYFNGHVIGGATATNYTILGVTSADGGNYSVVVSNPSDSATSAAAALSVQVPHSASATATVVNGFVVGANLTGGGFGYTNVPTVRVIGGGGSGATAVATMSNGVVTAVTIINPGKSYNNAPVIVIAPPFIQQPTMDIAALSLLSFTNLAVGTNYQLECVSGSLTPVGPPFTATSSTFTQMVSGTASATSYRLTATPAPIQAQATAEVVNGFVVAVTVTNGGSGYTTYPAVNITGGGGSNATAAVTGMTGGSITTLEVTNPGGGYTRIPNVIIALPPSTSLWPASVTQVMDLHLENLSPYDNYQLEFHPPAAGTWNDLDTPFTPTSTTSTQTIRVSGNAGIFRVRYAQ